MPNKVSDLISNQISSLQQLQVDLIDQQGRTQKQLDELSELIRTLTQQREQLERMEKVKISEQSKPATAGERLL